MPRPAVRTPALPVLLLALLTAVLAMPLRALEPLSNEGLQTLLDELIDTHPTAERTTVALKVLDLDTGEVLYDRHGDRLFTPASNLKIYTSAAALDLLGPDHRWTTEVSVIAQEASPDEGVVVVLRGGGDPMLSYDDLTAMLGYVVRERKLRSVKQVIVDNDAFAAPLKGPGWMWDDEPDYYNMSVTPLMVDFNLMRVVIDRERTDTGFVLRPRLEPPTSYPALRESGLGLDHGQHPGLARLGDDWDATRFPFEHDVWVNTAPRPRKASPGGAAAPDASDQPKTIELTMHDPTQWVEGLASQWLWDEGLLDERTPVSAFDRQNWRLYREINVDQDLMGDVVALEFRGKPLAEAVKHFNKVSENAVGEVLLLELGRRFGEGATWPSGAAVVTQWLTRDAGLEEGSFRLVDGSGLSRYNLISADSSVKLLAHMRKHRHFRPFFDSLPVYDLKLPGGESFAGVPLAEFESKRVFAKPGGMTGVSTISGYLQTYDGRWLAFSFLANGYTGPSAPARDLANEAWLALARYRVADVEAETAAAETE